MVRTPATAPGALVLAVATIATLVLGLVQAPSAAAGNGHRQRLLRLVNRTREGHDLRAVKLSARLSRDAMNHTRRMVRTNRNFDPPTLDSFLSAFRWNDVGVVGAGHTLRDLHAPVMTQTFHRAMILDGKLRRVGIGASRWSHATAAVADLSRRPGSSTADPGRGTFEPLFWAASPARLRLRDRATGSPRDSRSRGTRGISRPLPPPPPRWG